jgi:mono/diheme cytochrome c family protein
MRERWVYTVALLTGLLVTLLALAFAWMHAPPAPPGAPVISPERAAPALVETGRSLYQDQGCAMCHSIAGEGNPRSPLDGVGNRLDAAALRHWIVATGPAEEALPARVVRMKQAYRALPDAELDALVAYMQHLTEEPRGRAGARRNAFISLALR